jgi:hypothetical protein
MPMIPARETRFTMRPQPCSRIGAIACRAQWNEPCTWVATTRSKSAGSISQATPDHAIPALLTRMSMLPNSRCPVAMILAAPLHSVTESVLAAARAPPLRISSTTISAVEVPSLLRPMSLTTTAAPSLASA